MILVSFQEAKGGFFDWKKIKRGQASADEKRLSKFGAGVMMRARKSIKDKKGASRPGKPPHSHVGLLRENIFFFSNRQQHEVIIGPTALNKGTDAPELLEKGGTSQRKDRGGNWYLARYRPRPYMKPAFDFKLAKTKDLWSSSVRTSF